MEKLSPENIKYMWIALLVGLFFFAGLIGFLLGCIAFGIYTKFSNQNGKTKEKTK